MKKNLITVVILAISIINLVFNILLVFVFMPSTSKTNKLITDIAEVLDIEIASQTTVHLMLAIWHITSWNRGIQST